MSPAAQLIVTAALGVAFVGPLLLGFAGMPILRRERPIVPARWNVKLALASTLLYTLAFNLTFFVQEFFLVLPKALTPGLRPTLFHNNHSWEGDNPLANLFQGTGALATLILAIVCVWRLKRNADGSPTLRLFLIWMAYCGFFMALPQVAIGALNSDSDLGMAMSYFGLGVAAKGLAAFAALAAIAPIALSLTRPLLALCDDGAQLATARGRMRFVLQTATLPALVAIAPIVLFRVPREWLEVLLLPAWVSLFGTLWMQAGAWRMRDVPASTRSNDIAIAGLSAAVAGLLLLFQFVLRPGIRFF